MIYTEPPWETHNWCVLYDALKPQYHALLQYKTEYYSSMSLPYVLFTYGVLNNIIMDFTFKPIVRENMQMWFDCKTCI